MLGIFPFKSGTQKSTHFCLASEIDKKAVFYSFTATKTQSNLDLLVYKLASSSLFLAFRMASSKT